MESATDIQLLSDPCNDRVMKSIPPPPHKALTVDTLYKGGKLYIKSMDFTYPLIHTISSSNNHENIGKPDWKLLLENLKR